MAYLSNQQIERIVRHYGADILAHENMEISKAAMQHGLVSTYEHSFKVACLAVKMADRLHLWYRVDLSSLVRAALLHDYFLYDWHHHDDGSHRWHGFRHGRTAMLNGHRDFNLNVVERNSIHRHMFPLTPIPPKHWEGWLVTLADKISATVETVCYRTSRPVKRV
ncbi:HD domain-containing protein [Bifidobacterium gallicum]|nr:HD domain-containing protein [Bifidobacterium gallicum]